MTNSSGFGIMEFTPHPMSFLITVVLLLLLVPVAILVVGLTNVRRQKGRSANAGSDEQSADSSSSRWRASFPPAKPLGLTETVSETVRFGSPVCAEESAGNCRSG